MKVITFQQKWLDLTSFRCNWLKSKVSVGFIFCFLNLTVWRWSDSCKTFHCEATRYFHPLKQIITSNPNHRCHRAPRRFWQVNLFPLAFQHTMYHVLCHFLCSWWARWRRDKCPTAVWPFWWNRRRRRWIWEDLWRWTAAGAESKVRMIFFFLQRMPRKTLKGGDNTRKRKKCRMQMTLFEWQ